MQNAHPVNGADRAIRTGHEIGQHAQRRPTPREQLRAIGGVALVGRDARRQGRRSPRIERKGVLRGRPRRDGDSTIGHHREAQLQIQHFQSAQLDPAKQQGRQIHRKFGSRRRDDRPVVAFHRQSRGGECRPVVRARERDAAQPKIISMGVKLVQRLDDDRREPIEANGSARQHEKKTAERHAQNRENAEPEIDAGARNPPRGADEPRRLQPDTRQNDVVR